MPFPASLATATVTGQFMKYPGTAASGTITFSTPPGMFLQSTGDDIFVAPFSVAVALGEDGAFEVELPVTTDAQWTPQGWSYSVNVSVEGSTLVGSLSLAEVENGQTIDLADRFVSTPANAGASYVLLSTVGQIGGPAGPLDEDGLVPASQLPAGGGGSVVTWDDVTGKPTTFAPSAHTHSQSDVTGLTTALAGKAASNHTHSVRQTQVWGYSGTVAAGTGTLRWYNRTGQTVTVHGFWLAANTAPTGAALVVDANKNGTTMYATGKPSIAAGANASALVAPPSAVTLADGDYVTVDVDSVGSTVAGADLSVGMVYSYAV